MSRKIQMADVVRAHIEVRGCPVLTSNQCHAIAMNLNCQIGSTTAYDEAKERELFEVSHPVPEFVKWDDEFNQYLVSLYPGECDSEYGSLWDGWKACAKSRDRSAE